jgi:hypothetical protein
LERIARENMLFSDPSLFIRIIPYDEGKREEYRLLHNSEPLLIHATLLDPGSTRTRRQSVAGAIYPCQEATGQRYGGNEDLYEIDTHGSLPMSALRKRGSTR